MKEGFAMMKFFFILLLVNFSLFSPPVFAEPIDPDERGVITVNPSLESRLLQLEKESALQARVIHEMLDILDVLIDRSVPGGHVSASPIDLPSVPGVLPPHLFEAEKLRFDTQDECWRHP